MSLKTKVILILFVWIFSAICAVLGSLFIATAVILPATRFNLSYNPVLGELRDEMGPLTNFNYFNYEKNQYEFNITLSEDPNTGEIKALTQQGEPIRDFHIMWLEEVRENGSVIFHPEPNRLELYLYNGTIYAIGVKPDQLEIDLQAEAIVFNYQPGYDFKITRTTWEEDTTNPKVERIGSVFEVRNLGLTQWFQRIIQQIGSDFLIEFIFISRDLLIAVAIGGGLGILTAFFLVITRLASLFGGKYWTYFLLKALNGKLGAILSLIPIFDFSGDFFVEERFVDVVDLSSVLSTLKELYKQRWYDILVFPTALAAILTIIFVQNFPGDDKTQALVLSPLFSPLVLILILIYFPVVWAYNEGGFKRMEISPQGDIIAVKPLGKIMRDGLGIVIGFSGILSLGALGVEVGSSSDFVHLPTTTGQVQVAGFTLDIFGLLQLALWTLGLFFLLLGSIVVGASLLAVNNLEKSLFPTIKYLRQKSAKDDLITNWGSVTHQFTPVAKEAIFTKESPKD
jgi:hypothetical protein